MYRTGSSFWTNETQHGIQKVPACGDVIVKLVNLLPVEVNTNVDLSGIGAIQSSAKRTVLTGKPADTPLPVEDTMEVAEKFDYQLPAYSFTVIRIKKANEK